MIQEYNNYCKKQDPPHTPTIKGYNNWLSYNGYKILKGEFCEYCGEFVRGFEYEMCCSGRDCGCMGKPIEPCLCSPECWEAVLE